MVPAGLRLWEEFEEPMEKDLGKQSRPQVVLLNVTFTWRGGSAWRSTSLSEAAKVVHIEGQAVSVRLQKGSRRGRVGAVCMQSARCRGPVGGPPSDTNTPALHQTKYPLVCNRLNQFINDPKYNKQMLTAFHLICLNIYFIL